MSEQPGITAGDIVWAGNEAGIGWPALALKLDEAQRLIHLALYNADGRPEYNLRMSLRYGPGAGWFVAPLERYAGSPNLENGTICLQMRDDRAYQLVEVVEEATRDADHIVVRSFVYLKDTAAAITSAVDRTLITPVSKTLDTMRTTPR